MKNLLKIIGIIALVAVIGLSLVSCDELFSVITGGTQTFPTSLTSGVWTHSSLPYSTSEEWFSFYASPGVQYYLHWNDRYQGNNTKTCDVYVSAYLNDTLQTSFTGMDSGYTTSRPISIASGGSGGIIKLRVYTTTSSTSRTGSFAIGFSTGVNSMN